MKLEVRGDALTIKQAEITTGEFREDLILNIAEYLELRSDEIAAFCRGDRIEFVCFALLLPRLNAAEKAAVYELLREG